MNDLTWITGASSGLGAALARRMAQAGREVAISARSGDKLAALAGEAAGPGRLHPFPLDTQNAEDAAAAVARMEREVGQIDQVVLNAGTHQPVDPAHLRIADFRRLVEVNLMGTVNCLAAVLPAMLERRRGRIAIVASVAGYRMASSCRW